MTDPTAAFHFYEELRYWLPVTTVITLTITAWKTSKKSVSGWADKLLNNHLSHIEKATGETMIETQKTNSLLQSAALQNKFVAEQVATVSNTLALQNRKREVYEEKETRVWQGVLTTLALLEDRTKRSPRTPVKRKR